MKSDLEEFEVKQIKIQNNKEIRITKRNCFFFIECFDSGAWCKKELCHFEYFSEMCFKTCSGCSEISKLHKNKSKNRSSHICRLQ